MDCRADSRQAGAEAGSVAHSCSDAHPARVTYIAIAWSGAKSGERSKIWLGPANGGDPTRFKSGRSRDEVIDGLITMAAGDPTLVVGLDFAFSMPEWFIRDQGLTRIEDFWALVVQDAEGQLVHSPPPAPPPRLASPLDRD